MSISYCVILESCLEYLINLLKIEFYFYLYLTNSCKEFVLN